MSKYTVAVTHAKDPAAIIRMARAMHSPDLGITELRKRIGTDSPIFSFSTSSFPVEVEPATAVSRLREKMLGLLADLESSGATFQIQHHAGETVEAVSPSMLFNLLDSELVYLEQEHD